MITDIRIKTSDELVLIAGQKVIGTPSGMEAQQAQAELTKRLTDGITRLDQSTTKYSKVLMWLTIGLGVLAAIQIVLAGIQVYSK